MSEKKSGISRKVQAFGSFLSSMIMPNIAAFIAWGLITAMFIDVGWFPNEDLATMVDPMIIYLLPLLIAYTGGKLISDVRGGVVGATATMGVIAAFPDSPMLLGAMVMGPLGGYLMKKVDEVLVPRTRQGLEMLVNNFSAGFLAFFLALFGYYGIGPVVAWLTAMLGKLVDVIVAAGLLPIASIFIEPAKVLFLNNAINHGVLTPLASEEVREVGRSILFTLESNPGPGFGILLAYMIFGKGTARATAPGAAIIQFVGGIHEIYFPYILMKPTLVIAAILGGASGILTFSLLDFGLSGPPAPGSILAYIAMTPRGEYLSMFLGIIAATLVSFIVASLILKFSKQQDEAGLEAATAQMEESKGKKSSVAGSLTQTENVETSQSGFNYSTVDKIVFACDAGMGSSAMGAGMLKNKFKKAGLDIEVTNSAINQLKGDEDIIITQKTLTERAENKVPTAKHISVDNFLNSPKYDELLADLQDEQQSGATAGEPEEPAQPEPSDFDYSKVDKIVFACDAGMGSSAMGAGMLKNKFKKAGLDIDVTNSAINQLKGDEDIIITQKVLTERAENKVPAAKHISVDNFLNSPHYDELTEELKKHQ
ncbi:PTS mannitol-specific transporter subunit IIBC [Salinicoccus halodurans]|uniref:PTS system mannitol-specific EIICB component n=1 Tax=Salinicoccus halodurans TaxID=407035 RepID=A0A0F7HNP8_9STAP|nr:PTS mannitol-specific transporter subunit IIBC [Salinicoccus halodurans]AKG74848.1 PTS mannitol transferase subunit IIB [Salinicoccus halodurans]SFK69496.1 PTS system, mannitol-specific IIC component [Salinicoccus halodurans]